MLRTRSAARPLSLADRDEALDVCARDLPSGVFVAARILEGARAGSLSSVLGHRTDGELTSLCWASANVVPVATTEESRGPFADRVRRWRGRCASVFGPRAEVEDLWRHLEPSWGPARAVREHQPLLVADRLRSALRPLVEAGHLIVLQAPGVDSAEGEAVVGAADLGLVVVTTGRTRARDVVQLASHRTSTSTPLAAFVVEPRSMKRHGRHVSAEVVAEPDHEDSVTRSDSASKAKR